MTAPIARGEGGPVTRRTARLAAGLVAALLSALALTAAAHPGTTATVGECLDSGQVWLHVETPDQVLRSECVGTPDSGSAALAAADVATSESKGGYLCTLSGYPDRCPTRYNGQYWQYSHASGVGAAWQYSQKGAGEFRPAPGSIEGWCYNTADENRCALPSLSADDTAAERVDVEATGGGLGPWVIGGVVLVVLAGALAVRRLRNR
ncbi:hypothetical protein [Nocardioides alcanivorans]|uniref:hypothetical protein n=1 Tax=Nocardioides alcanivorans TaxID=2897352 RepID=UPI001F28C5D8|nr:hypothetical protein [Nocardioides alcanivorans]